MKLERRLDFQSITAGHDVLWAITHDSMLLARSGISRHTPSGTGWEQVGSIRVQCVSLARKNYGWCISKEGIACFMSNVAMKMPSGDERWWNVSMGQLLLGTTFMESLLSWPFGKRSDPLSMVASCEHCVFAISSASVISSCSGSMEGSLYRPASPLGTAQSMTWCHVAANALYDAESRIWALRPNGELFCFQRGRRPDAVESPSGRHQLVRLSISSEAVWGLTTEGVVLERAGLSRFCPVGTNWRNIPVDTLAGAKVVDIACGLYWVWAVDDKGFVWLRPGPLAESKDSWRRIEPFSWTVRFVRVSDGCRLWKNVLLCCSRPSLLFFFLDGEGTYFACWTKPDKILKRASPTSESTQFCPPRIILQLYGEQLVNGSYLLFLSGLCVLLQIVSGADWLVWALDSNGSAYARKDISAECPAGTEWEHIPGLSSSELAISSNAGVSSNTVWARCTNGAIVSRNNVSPRSPVGDYWKRIPGNFLHISATPDNELWVIDNDGRLFVRETNVFHGQHSGDDCSLDGWDVL